AFDLARDRRRGTAELGEHDLVLERVLGRILVLRARGRCLAATGVDAVLLAAAIPGRRHLRPDATNAIVTGQEPFACRGHGLVPLRVAHAMAPCGLAHVPNDDLNPASASHSPSTAATSRAVRDSPALPMVPSVQCTLDQCP